VTKPDQIGHRGFSIGLEILFELMCDPADQALGLRFTIHGFDHGCVGESRSGQQKYRHHHDD